MKSVIQEWVSELSAMQQTVLLSAIRGPDGLEKYAAIKYLLRWYRRCILYSAMDGKVLDNPYSSEGGSFMGPSIKVTVYPLLSVQWEQELDSLVGEYIRGLDGVPHHFQLHFMHAAEILGYKHPNERIRIWWREKVYFRLVKDMHLVPEAVLDLDTRLGDNRDNWLKYADKATQA